MSFDRDTYYRQHRHRTFAEILADPNDDDPSAEGKTGYTYFIWKIMNVGIPLSSRLLPYSTGAAYEHYDPEAMYYLLLSKYANNSISSSDEQRFWMELTSIMFQHGPEWQRLTKLQDDLLSLSNDDLVKGAVAINNYADHPDTTPGVSSPEMLTYISNQSAQIYQKDKVDGYTRLMPWIEMDTTEKFIGYFKKLFTIFAYDYAPLLYRQGDED